MTHYLSVPNALDRVRYGIPVIIVDEPDRENEGDLFVIADKFKEEDLEFMRREAKGNICVPLAYAHAERLGLRLQHPDHAQDASVCRALCEVDYRGIKDHGVSYRDKLLTIRLLANELAQPQDFVPGHIRPLRADEGLLVSRRGHTEAAVKLAGLVDSHFAGVICEILGKSGMARGKELEEFSYKHSIDIVTIADLVSYQ